MLSTHKLSGIKKKTNKTDVFTQMHTELVSPHASKDLMN
jgi:hypothetical protein